MCAGALDRLTRDNDSTLLPLMEWQTIGHERIREVLNRQLVAGRMSQAYLFIGPYGVGKYTLAAEFARKISNTEQTHQQPIEFSFAQSSLEEVRGLTHQLSLRPQSGTMQVAILDHVEEMTSAAANALLKTIEEPSSSTVLLLIASRDNVLATIRSRCQVFQFGRLSSLYMHAWAEKRGFGTGQEAALLAADGSPGQFLAETQTINPQASMQWQQYLNDFQELLEAPLSRRLSFISRWAGDDVEASSARIAAWLTALYKQPTLCKETTKSLSVLLEAWRRLQTNANKKLVLEYVCINIL